MPEKADLLSGAMEICTGIEKKVVVTGDKSGATCREFADYVVDVLKKLQ